MPGCFTADYVKGNKICHVNNIQNDIEGPGIKISATSSLDSLRAVGGGGGSGGHHGNEQSGVSKMINARKNSNSGSGSGPTNSGKATSSSSSSTSGDSSEETTSVRFSSLSAFIQS